MSDTEITMITTCNADYPLPPTYQALIDENAQLRARVAELEQDKARLDWLESLRDRHEMVGCHKGKANPTGFRRYECDSDIHLRGDTAAVYLRNELGQVVRSGNAPTLRAANDAAKEEKT